MSEDKCPSGENLGEWAVWYVERGFGVFPLKSHGKRPAVEHGLNDWTDNPDDVRKWWAQHPDHNIGIACGTPSGGLLVFDLDEHGDGASGLRTLREWEKVNGELPETATAKTGSGGIHLLYRTDRTNIHPSVNNDLGVDVRSDGSYIVAPPSIHPSGEPYIWDSRPSDEDAGIATANGAVYDFLDYVQRNGGEDEIARKPNGKFRLPDVVNKGERDTMMFKWASHLRAVGRSDDEILAAVMGENVLRCKPPLGIDQVQRIVKSACRYDRGEDGGESSDRTVGAPGKGDHGDCGRPSFIGPRGGVDSEKLGDYVLDRCHARIIDGAPAIWTGRRWDFGAKAIKRATLHACRSAKIKDLNEVVTHVQYLAPHVTSDRAFDGRYYVQFSDVTVDVQTLAIVEPTPDMFIVGTLPVTYDPAAIGNERANSFLDSISGGNEAVRTAMAEVIGACMCSSRIVSEAPMLIGRANGGTGKAANGKSTYINYMRAILGSENVCSLDIGDYEKQFQRGVSVGKLANLGDDMSASYLKDNALSVFKKLVTGDTLYSDVKNSDGFEYKPCATQVFSMNEIPHLADTTDGIFRRLYFLPFYRTFTPDDADYNPRISRELAQDDVLRAGAAIGLDALQQLIDDGEFVRIPEMVAEAKRVRADNSSVARWMLDTEVRSSDLAGETVESVYQRYVNWCRDAGEQFPRQKNSFSRELKDLWPRFHERESKVGQMARMVPEKLDTMRQRDGEGRSRIYVFK